MILDQLHLLHQVTGDVLRAQAEHDDRELRVQESFLRERFARTANGLDLTPSTGAAWVSGVGPKTPIPARRNAPRTGPRGLAASTLTTHHRLVVDQRPTAVFNPDAKSDGILRARLALPPGVSVVLGAVIEKHSAQCPSSMPGPNDGRRGRGSEASGHPKWTCPSPCRWRR